MRCSLRRGLYGAAAYYGGVTLLVAFAAGIATAAALSMIVGVLALRTQTVPFMIVTLTQWRRGRLFAAVRENPERTRMRGYPACPRMSASGAIAYAFQITNIYPAMTVCENLTIAAQGRVRHGADIGAAALDAARAVDLQNRLADPAGALSYGHQRLLEVAMTLALRPKLLILDEPTQRLSDAGIGHMS